MSDQDRERLKRDSTACAALAREEMRGGEGMECTQCGVMAARMVCSMTAYYWPPAKPGCERSPDPNRPIPLCPECAEEYRDHVG